MDNRISVIINTLNEEADLPNAIASVRPWADEVIVVDMYSDDRTVQIAQQMGAKVYMHERIGLVEPARALGIDVAAGPWILILDADEMIPPPLSRLLLRLAASDEADVFGIPRVNYQFGRPLMHCGKGPDKEYHSRFFKKGKARVCGKIHWGFETEKHARYKKLDYRPGEAMIHFEFRDLDELLEKFNRYSGFEARQGFASGSRTRPSHLLVRPLREFWNRYVVDRGWRDGRRGFYYCLFKAFYRFSIHAKLMLLQEGDDPAAVEKKYSLIARQIIDEYDRSDQRAAPVDSRGSLTAPPLTSPPVPAGLESTLP